MKKLIALLMGGAVMVSSAFAFDWGNLLGEDDKPENAVILGYNFDSRVDQQKEKPEAFISMMVDKKDFDGAGHNEWIYESLDDSSIQGKVDVMSFKFSGYNVDAVLSEGGNAVLVMRIGAFDRSAGGSASGDIELFKVNLSYSNGELTYDKDIVSESKKYKMSIEYSKKEMKNRRTKEMVMVFIPNITKIVKN